MYNRRTMQGRYYVLWYSWGGIKATMMRETRCKHILSDNNFSGQSSAFFREFIKYACISFERGNCFRRGTHDKGKCYMQIWMQSIIWISFFFFVRPSAVLLFVLVAPWHFRFEPTIFKWDPLSKSCWWLQSCFLWSNSLTVRWSCWWRRSWPQTAWGNRLTVLEASWPPSHKPLTSNSKH